MTIEENQSRGFELELELEQRTWAVNEKCSIITYVLKKF